MAHDPSKLSPTPAIDTRYSFGIEEEFFLSSLTTRTTIGAMPRDFYAACERALPGVVERELLQSQIEIATPPCQEMGQARALLARYRAALGAVAAEHGLAPIAAGAHPAALWSRQKPTDAARYDRLMKDLQMLGARNMVCGLHVHVAIPDPSRRAAILTRLIPFLPLFLALSASSPFWQGRRTGLMAYRLAAYDELPRTGIPDAFGSDADYRRYVDILVAAGAIPDASYLWWAARLSEAHPTLELRVADACTRLDDSVGLAALFRALVRRLDRDDAINAGVDAVTRAIAVENKWRAQRYGVHGRFIDERRRAAVEVATVLDETIALVAEDAQALGCRAELERLRIIAAGDSSADRQLEIWRSARARKASRAAALAEVVDWLAQATLDARLPEAGRDPRLAA